MAAKDWRRGLAGIDGPAGGENVRVSPQVHNRLADVERLLADLEGSVAYAEECQNGRPWSRIGGVHQLTMERTLGHQLSDGVALPVTAIVVPIPLPGALVAAVDRTAPGSVGVAMPPHVTILYPFLPSGRLDEGILDGLKAVAIENEAFAVRLAELRRFERVLYLAPDPAEPFVRMARALNQRFRADLPDGRETSYIPHLTVGIGSETVLDSTEDLVAPLLPVTSQAKSLAVYAQQPTGVWYAVCSVRMAAPKRMISACPSVECVRPPR